MRRLSFKPSVIRLSLWAPMFWAVKEERPLARVDIQVTEKVFSLMAEEYPAMTAEPKLLTKLWMNRFPTETKLCCKMLGTAMTEICPSRWKENSGNRFVVGICFRRCRRAASASREEMPCAAKVAHATPATPMSKAMTKSKSRAIFPKEEPMRKYKGVRESPKAVKMPVPTLYKNRNRNPKM